MLKKIIRKLGIAIQRIIISILLFVIYYLVFGLTVVIALLFNRKILNWQNSAVNSSWHEANGYDPDIANSRMQS